jgi:hypothetical protein
VMVGRIGAFGLILQSLGIDAFDSGLGLAESHDLASLNRSMTSRERARRAENGGGGPPGRVYLESLKTTLPAKSADEIVKTENLRHHFACSLVAAIVHVCGRLAADPVCAHPQIAQFLRTNAAKLRPTKCLQRGESPGPSHPL